MNHTHFSIISPRALRLATVAAALVSLIGAASASQIAGNTIGSVVTTKQSSSGTTTKTTTSSTVSTKKGATAVAPAASSAKH